MRLVAPARPHWPPLPQTSDKIVLSERLEEIRSTIIQNMLTYHPESREVLAAGRRVNYGRVAAATCVPFCRSNSVASSPR